LRQPPGTGHVTSHEFGSVPFVGRHNSRGSVARMPRHPRVQTPGPYHVTTRGNNGAPIYHDDDDRRLFVVLLHRTAAPLQWRVHLWCLMTNHFHLLIETKAENLAQGMQRLNSGYAHALNDRHERTGHVFERRYASRPIESERQFRNTALYIVHNPVAAELCEELGDWPWMGGLMLGAALGAE
jgi:putative transposase